MIGKRFARWLVVLLAVFELAVPAHAAISWTVVVPADCTALGAPAECCISGNPASNAGLCTRRMNFGDLFEVIATFSQAATGTYSTGGDALPAAQFAKLGLNKVIAGFCQSASRGYDVNLARTGTPVGVGLNIKLFDGSCPATGTGCAAANEPCPCCTALGVGATCNGPQEVAAGVSVTAQTITCVLYGL